MLLMILLVCFAVVIAFLQLLLVNNSSNELDNIFEYLNFATTALFAMELILRFSVFYRKCSY
jgi:hypothetical protein